MTVYDMLIGIVTFAVAAVYSDARREHATDRLRHEINNLTVRINGLEARIDRLKL